MHKNYTKKSVIHRGNVDNFCEKLTKEHMFVDKVAYFHKK
jgi:hypothetical protein